MHFEKRWCPSRNQLFVLLHLSGSLGDDAIAATTNTDFFPNDRFQISFAVNIGNEQVAIGLLNAASMVWLLRFRLLFVSRFCSFVQIQINAILLNGFPGQEALDLFPKG